jgi:hypothetical protein
VIVSLRPDAEGETLAALSRLSPRAPAGAPPPAVRIYYDLQDEPIRAQLRASVSQALDQILSALDHPGLALIQRFTYQYGFAAQVTADALHRMLAHPDVVRVEPDRPLIPARPNPDHDATEPRTSTAASHPDEPSARASAREQDAPPAATMAALITQWERFIDRLDEAGDPPLPPVLAAGLGGQPAGGPGACDPRLPALAQAAANAEAAGISLFAPAGDDGDCAALSWPACLSAVNAVGAVYAADQGLVGWCAAAASCAEKTPDETCATGYLALEPAVADQVPAASNSSAQLALLAPVDLALTGAGTEGTRSATAAAVAAATTLQNRAWEGTLAYLSPLEVRRILTASGEPIIDTKSGIATPRIDPPRSLEFLPNRALDGLDRAAGGLKLPHTRAQHSGRLFANRDSDASPPAAFEDSAAADTGAPLTCPPDRGADLVDQYVTDTRIYQTCETLAAGPFTVAGTGNVTFEAGQSINFRPGFRVAPGGRLITRITSALATSPGALQVTINPAEALAAGAQWRPSGSGIWRDSGFTESGLAVGEHQVEFKPIADWVTPQPATIMVAPASTTALTSIYSPVPIDESISVTLPPAQTEGLELTSLLEEGIEVTDQQITVPSNTQSLVLLTDAEDNLAGVGISSGDGGLVTIDATSTAIGLVMMAYPGWSTLSLTKEELEVRIRSAAGFQNLVDLIEARQQTDAARLLDDVDILSAITGVVLEVLQTVTAERPQATVAASSWPDAPWVENGNTIRNPRYVPYGLSTSDSYRFFQRPFILDEREFSWELDWVPIQPSDPTAATFTNFGQGKLCAVRYEPRINYFAGLMAATPVGGIAGDLLVGTYDILSADLYALPADQGLYRRAELHGMLSWTVSILLNVAKSVPGASGIVGSASQVLWNQIKDGGDLLAFTSDVAEKGVGELIPLVLDYAYETRTEAGSLLRKTAQAVFNDGRKIRILGITANFLSKLFAVPQYLTDVWFVKDTALAPVSACYLIEGGNAVPFDPFSPSISVPPLNDTGIDWCANASQNNLPCPVTGYPGQDAQYGRDQTANNDSDGHAGFSFTKLDANGNALPASAGSWSCVRDNVTGLTWEVKTDDGGLRDQDWTYSWYNPDTATNGGSAGYADYGDNCFNTARCDTDKFVADVKAQGLCGASDWRLPNRFELESLTSNDRYYPNPTIDTAFFPNTLSTWFWSSSPYATYASGAWGVYFSYGLVYISTISTMPYTCGSCAADSDLVLFGGT